MSKAIQSRLGFTRNDLDAVVAGISEMVIPNAPLADDLKARLRTDLGRLAAEVKGALPEPGALLSFSFLNGRGFELYTHNLTENLSLDDSKPLTLVEHLGGSPVGAWLARSKGSGQAYEVLAKWLEVAFGYFEEAGLPQMSAEEQAKYKQVKEVFLPLVKRADVATRTMLLPGLADGQAGLVLDAKITSSQWHQQMPASKAPLPMAEMALVVGVSDAALVRKAFAEYKSIADEVLVKLKELNPGEIPADFKLPDATARAVKRGTIYSYALPKEAQLDAQLAPNAGLGEKLAVLSLAPKHTERLMEAAPLVANGPLADTKRPLASIAHFNWAALVDAVLPWVEYGVRAAEPSAQAALEDAPAEDEAGAADAGDQARTAFILQHVRTVAEALKALGAINSVTYAERGALVTHTEWRFEDVK
jgi:hypothetical protein